MKIKLKRQTEAPPNVKEAVSRISSTPFGDLGRALAGFRWAFDKGDINHWVPVLDHFDSFLEQYVSKRADVQLTGTVEGLVNESVFPTEVVLAVLSATCSILENCSNKGAYNSAEHLSSLLAAPGREVSTAALRVFQVLMRKTHHTSVRVAVPSGLTKRLLSLCRGWGGKEEGLDLAFCASSREATDNRVLRKATTLHFEFTPDKQPQGNGAAGSTAGVQPVTLHIPNMEKFSEPEHTILMELVQRFSIPATVRFDLLCRIRIARNFGTLAGRRQLIRQRLLAFNVLLQCSPSAEEYTTLYLAEPEIVNELVGLVQAEEAVEDEELRILALKALGAQLHDRSRSSNVITAVTSGGQSGLLAMLLHKSVSSILHQAQVPLAASGSGLPWHHAAAAAAAAAPQPERTHIGSSDAAVAATQPIAVAALAQSSMQYSVSFVDALLTLVAAMVTSSTGCQALNDAGVISALLPLLRDLHPDHLGIICTSLKILEMYMDLSQTASTTFRELGGLTEVIRRLATEVKSVADPAARPAEAATVGQGPEDVLMTAADQSVDQTTADMAYQAAQTSAKQLPHNRKTLLKILLRIITISSYQPTGNLTATRPVDDDAHMLYAALSAIYGHPEEFGGTLFSHAVSVMTDLIHHEPQSFRQLQEAGLPDAFLAAVKAAVFPTGDAIVSIPGALVALCLNSIGLKQVRETCALNVLVNVFTSKKVLRVLTGDTPSVLGSGLEELMRFVPSLRSDGVNVVLGVFRALCVLGGDDEEFEAASKPLPPDVLQGEAAPSSNITPQDAEVAASARRAASASASAQPMETDAAGPTAAHAVDVQPAEEEVLGSIQNTTTSLTAVNVPVDGSADGMDVDTHPGVAATLATAAVAPEQPSVVSRAVALNSVGAQTAQQEREAERQRQQQDDERLSAIAGRALAESLQQVAARRDQDADVEAYLPLALTAASRMLEPLLANGETSRLFVERGGAELLLKLYKLPRLTTVFNFSSASHSLLSVFRALSGAHGTAIAAQSKETVAQQLAVLLPMAEEIGAVCVPTLPAEQRDLYTKQVLVVQGLVALTSAVARNVTAMLPQVSMGDPPLLATMGKLERIVMAQTAVSDPWKQARDAAKKVAAAAEAGGTSAIGADAPAEAAAEPVGADAGEGIEMEAVGAEEELVGTAGAQALARGGPDATTASTNIDVNANNRQKRAPEDISYDALNYLLTSLRTFYMGTAKAIHTPVRRREDPVTSPTAPMKAAALNLALLLVGNLQLRPWPQTQQQQCQWTNAEHAMVQAAAASAGIGEQTSSCYHQPLDVAVTTVRQCSGHFLRVSEELNQVLFDSRRHYCHLLVLNYFSALGGMQALASALSEASELLWSLLDLQAPPRSEGKAKEGASGDQLMADTGSGTEQAAQALPSEAQAAPTPASPAAAVAVPGAASTKDPKQVMEAVMVKLLAIYEQLANATILLSAPQATSMLLAALPNYAGQPLVPPPKDPLNFVQQLHSHILSAVLPLWNHPKAAYAPSGVLNSIVRVLMTSFQGPGPASIVLRYSQQGRPAAARVQAQPDPQMVQQIMEMGFSQARAEEALRRVGANSVELAMEWLISQPDEAAATAGAATAAAATAGTNAEGAGGSSAATVSEEEELTRALLASLSVVGMSPDAVAQQSQQQLLAEQATRGDDTAEGAPAEIEDIATTPQTTPRPLVQPGAPVLGAAAAAAAIVGSAVELPAIAPNAPAPSQLLDGALRLIGTSPSTAFLISDLLLTIAQREEGRDRGALLDQLIDKCLPPVSETGEVWEETQLRRADVLPPTRLLLLLLHKDVASRRVAAGKGLVVRCLKALEAWQHQYRLHVQAYESSSDKQHKELIKELEVPVWVEAFLMLLDIMATTSTESENTSRRAARATRAVHVPEGGAAPVEAVAAPVVAPGTAVPSTAQVDEEDMQTEDQPAATASTEAVVAGNQLPATRAATEATAKLPAELSQLSGLTEVLRNWRPCGALDHEQQQRATTVALTLLQHLHHFADKWDHPSASMFECDASMPNPGSVTTAVLQLLSHLTKRHSNAQQVLAAGGHQLLLSLPSACLAPSISRQETHIGSVLRHLLEDQITLESWMESEIKNSMSFKGARDSYMAGRAYHSNRNPLSRYATAGSFLTMMSSLVSREPAVFLQAVARTCALETVRGETMVRLKTAREQQQGHLPVIGNRDAPVVGEATGTPAIGASGRGRALPAEAAASPDALTATVGVAAMLDGASERHGHKVTAKSSKKLVPASFVEVVDALLDVVLSYNGLPSPHAQQHSQPDNVPAGDAAAMELDGASVPAPMQPAASGSQGLSSRHDAAPVPADLLLRQLNPVSREVGIQAMVLRLLADYCLLYNNTVGLLLKRDSEGGPADARSLQHHHQHAAPQQLSPAESSRTSARVKSSRHSSAGGSSSGGTGRLSTPGATASSLQEHRAGAVLKHIMHVQLVDATPEGAQAGNGVAANASALLQAVCIRSGEGRKRVLNELVAVLAGTESSSSSAAAETGRDASKLPYIHLPDGPNPFQVAACVDLMGALAQNSNSLGMARNDPRQQNTSTSMPLELLRAMREAGAIKALTHVITVINTDHNKAKDAINAVLKPLEVLTRPLPKAALAADGSLDAAPRGAQTRRQEQQTAPSVTAGDVAQLQPASGTAGGTQGTPGNAAATRQAQASAPAAAAGPAAAGQTSGAAREGHTSARADAFAPRTATAEHQQQHDGEEAAGPDALAAAGRFVSGGAGQAPGQIPGALIDQLMDQLVDIEVELDAAGSEDDSAGGSSADVDDSDEVGSSDDDEDMADLREEADMQGQPADGATDEDDVVDAPSLTEEEGGTDDVGEHGAVVAAPGIGLAGHGMAEIDSSEDDRDSAADDEDNEHGHHHQHDFGDAMLPDDDMHIMPPQLDGHHHPQEDGVVDPLDGEDEEEEDEYLDDDDDDDDQSDDENGLVDAAMADFLDGGAPSGWDAAPPGDLDDLPGFTMPGGFGRMTARRMAYRPTATAAAAGVWDDSEQGDAAQDVLGGVSTAQMLLSQLGLSASGDGGVSRFGPNGRQYRVSLLGPDSTASANTGTAGSEAVAGAMSSALYTLSTQLMPQQHRLLALPPRLPVSENVALLQSAAAVVPGASGSSSADAASVVHGQASSINALTRLLTRAPENGASTSYLRESGRARLVAQRQGGNLFSITLDSVGLPAALGPAANFLQSFELLQPGGMLGGPPGAGALADLDNSVWDEAVNQLLEALAPQGLGRSRAAPSAAAARAAGGQADEASIDPRSLESQLLTMLRAQAPNEPSQQQQQQQQEHPATTTNAAATGEAAAGAPPAQYAETAAVDDGSAPTGLAAGEAAPPASRSALTEETIAAALQLAMQSGPAPAASQDGVVAREQQQQAAAIPAVLSSHPVDIPSTAPESPNEAGAVRGADTADAALNQPTPMETEEIAPRTASASAEPLGTVTQDGGHDSQQQPPSMAAVASDMEVEGDTAVLEALRQAAEAAEIDLAFLEALPEELRVEVLSARGVELRLPQPTVALPQPELPAAPLAIPDSSAAAAAAAQSSAEEERWNVPTPAPAAPEATAGAEHAEGTTAVPAPDAAAADADADAAGPAAAAEEDAIDPEFLAALPEDIRQEVLAQQAAERRARAAAARATAQRQQELGLADLLAAMDEDARADALGQLSDSDLAQLPPAMRAQARALRERALRHQQALQHQQQAAAAVQQQQHDLLLRRAQLGASALNGLVPGAGGRLLMTLGPDGLPVSSRNRFGPLSAALGGSGMRSLSRAELLDAGSRAANESEGPPLLGDSELAVLVQLLQASLPLSKAHLQKLFLNVAGHSSSRKQLLKMLLMLLRSLHDSTDGTVVEDTSKSAVIDANTSEATTMQQTQQSLSTTLDMLGSAAVSSVSGPASAAPHTKLMSSATAGKPAVVGRRVLDMLVYLSRHSQRVACQMLSLPVDATYTGTGNEKSRGKLPATVAAAATPRGLEVLLDMLSAPLCQRSVSLLEQLTVLLEVILSVVQRFEADQQVLAAIKQARKKQEEEASGSQPRQQEQIQPTSTAAGGDGSQTDPQQPPTTTSPEAAATPSQPVYFQPAVQQHTRSDEPQQQQPEPQLASTLASIQPGLLQQLPRMLAQETLSESAYISIAKVVKLVVELAPIHLPMMLDVLIDGVAGVAQALLTLLDTVTDKGLDADVQPAPMIGVKSGVVLRMLYALQGFQAEIKRSKQSIEEQQQQQQQQHNTDGQRQQQPPPEQATGVGSAAESTVNQGSLQDPPGQSSTAARAPSAAGPGSSTAASAVNRLDPETAVAELDKAVAAVATRTAPLWNSLSKCILRVEDSLRAVLPQYTQGAGESAGHAAARLLPPGAQQVLPLVEAFFVLCALQGTLPAAPTTGKDLLTAASAEPSLLTSAAPEAAAAGASGSLRRSPAAVHATPSASQLKRGASAALEGTGPSEGYMPFLQFAERHRRLLNAYIRRNSSLLESSLAPLLRVPKLIDFDNKRAYFKSKVRAQEDRAYTGGLRLAVKRSTVFEDSFNKLRSRTPAEMRGKLSVSFVGEEGIDAGGVSREWYQVMAREIFNPNLALFVSVPEGGTTFQPNPNSVVQSDTGVSHLEYFKFVGRLVGKALYDGQLMDAYFTRSFYKHMLGQPLTYEDIEAVDPEYYKNLKWMLENDITDVLDLTFTAESDFFGKTEVVELVPGGREVKVTEGNKHDYVNLIARHRMTTSIKPQIQAFLEGFWQLISRELISIFNDHELELLISGLPDIDVSDLRANTEYTGYTAASPVIQWFWQVVADMDKQDLALLLQFVTGTSKVPLGGFKTLQGISGPQRFQIHKSYGADRLPSAHTCFNQLDLPEYDSKEQLAERLAMAIHEGHEGFGFG